MRFVILFLFLLVCFIPVAIAQKGILDEVNAYPFEPEGPIKGIGYAVFDNGGGKEVTAIRDMNGQPFIFIEVKTDSVITKVGNQVYLNGDTTNAFKPKDYNPSSDYFLLILECTYATDLYYEAIIDRESGRKGLISKADSLFTFLTPDKYVQRYSDGLDFDRVVNPLRKKPDEHGQIILNKAQEKYRIWRAERLEMNGDWMKVKVEGSEEGWIRWRKGKTIIIRLYFFC